MNIDDSAVFTSLEDAKKYIDYSSKQAGFKMYFKGLNKTTGKGKFVCHKHGVYISKAIGARNNTSSIKTGCKFVIYLYRKSHLDDHGAIAHQFKLTLTMNVKSERNLLKKKKYL